MGYVVKPIVRDYGVFDKDKLLLICRRKRNAELIVKILEVDDGQDAEHHYDGIARDFGSDEITYQEWLLKK